MTLNKTRNMIEQIMISFIIRYSNKRQLQKPVEQDEQEYKLNIESNSAFQAPFGHNKRLSLLTWLHGGRLTDGSTSFEGNLLEDGVAIAGGPLEGFRKQLRFRLHPLKDERRTLLRPEEESDANTVY